MTKITILGQEPKEEKKKPIKAIACIQEGEDGILYYGNYTINEDKEIRVIRINNKSYPFDCIIIDSKDNVLIGHFNDGIV